MCACSYVCVYVVCVFVRVCVCVHMCMCVCVCWGEGMSARLKVQGAEVSRNARLAEWLAGTGQRHGPWRRLRTGCASRRLAGGAILRLRRWGPMLQTLHANYTGVVAIAPCSTPGRPTGAAAAAPAGLYRPGLHKGRPLEERGGARACGGGPPTFSLSATAVAGDVRVPRLASTAMPPLAALDWPVRATLNCQEDSSLQAHAVLRSAAFLAARAAGPPA